MKRVGRVVLRVALLVGIIVHCANCCAYPVEQRYLSRHIEERTQDIWTHTLFQSLPPWLSALQ